MRIVTRPDFDGVVCAVLLHEAEDITEPINWVQPSEMQKGLVPIRSGDIIANLPYRENCAMWFDHHYSNHPRGAFKGAFRIAPSAAGVVFDFYDKQFEKDFVELVDMTDKIDSADLTREEVNCPENFPYILLSMTINGRNMTDEPYWNRLVDLLRSKSIEAVMADSDVRTRCLRVIEDNRAYKALLMDHTRLEKHVSITDFRPLSPAPDGNRFLVYALFPKAVVSVKIRYDDDHKNRVIVSVGHSIFNRNCQVNAGQLLSQFEGGGHNGAASCKFHVDKADDYIPRIIDTLLKNESNV
jgi:oligoribonuclease NrnB/cAMP/cGMP phosphodiesterase (DHH superfamily)